MTWIQKWQVPSSTSDAIYTVGVNENGEYACPCIGWTRHVPRKDCKHIKQVRDGIAPTVMLRNNYTRNPQPFADRAKARGAYLKTPMPLAPEKQEPLTIARPMRLIDLPD